MKAPCLFIFSLIPVLVSAQAQIKGKVIDSKSDVPLAGATVYNASQRIYRKASFEGQYSIIATEKDSIIFSSAGYRSDTIEVSGDLLLHGLDIGLKSLPQVLDTVNVSVRSYADDSIQRRLDYSQFYNTPVPGITGRNTPSHGFGISLSPFSFFSKKEKAKREFRRQLRYDEEQAYIDYYFTPSYVHRITGLSGQQLKIFMRTYRPSYSFMRQSTPELLLNYLNDSFKDFSKNNAAH